MLKIKDLHVTYNGDVRALKNVNLEIKQGEFIVFLGKSGAGKSTLLRCINNIVKPSNGEIFFEDQPINNSRNINYVRKKTGMIFQQYNIIKRLSVLQNVLCGRLAYNNVGLTCLKLFPKNDVDLALNCIERVGLLDKAYTRADQLSGGQQQRVGIARALVQQPKLMLADEPVASLDPYSSQLVMDILKEININDGITTLVSLHNIQLAQKYAERIIGIQDGEIMFDEKASELNDKNINIIYGGAQEDCKNNRDAFENISKDKRYSIRSAI